MPLEILYRPQLLNTTIAPNFSATPSTLEILPTFNKYQDKHGRNPCFCPLRSTKTQLHVSPCRDTNRRTFKPSNLRTLLIFFYFTRFERTVSDNQRETVTIRIGMIISLDLRPFSFELLGLYRRRYHFTRTLSCARVFSLKRNKGGYFSRPP